MRKLSLFYLILTAVFIGLCYKVKDDYFYLPYPNAIEYVLSIFLLLVTLITLVGPNNRGNKIVLGFSSILMLLIVVNGMNYLFEWHPLNLPLPLTKSLSIEVDHEPYGWETASPASVGYDEEEMEQYLTEVNAWGRLRGLLIVKDDKFIVEHYQRGSTRYSAFNVHSITKSILSALTGLAIQKGYLASEHALVMPYFPEYK